MAQPVDPNEVLMTGENSFIRLSADGGKTHTSRVSHWRVLWCPAGAGHAMFLQSPLIENSVQIYSDNLAVARWLQRTIETLLYPPFADVALPVHTAQFARAGDPHSAAVETVDSALDSIVLTWHDCIEPLGLSITEAARALGVTRQALNNLVNGRAGISPEMAIRLEKAGWSNADHWLRLQTAYDLAQARQHEGEIKVRRYKPRRAA